MRAPPLRAIHQLAAWLALGGIAIALSMLFGAERGLTIVHTQVDGVPISVFARRNGAPAPSVLIGHGFAGSRQLMQPFALTMARNGYVAVTFDFPGHGRNRTPLAGTLGEPERAAALLDAFRRVADHARTLPASDGRLATLGHSMAGDILVRYADIDLEVNASIAVSPYLSRELGTTGPSNLLLVYGEYEPKMILEQGRDALAAVAGLPADEIELDRLYGDMANGSARRMVVAQGVEHIGVLYSETSLQAALEWLNQVYGRQSDGAIDTRAPWLGLFYAGVLLLAWPLSQLLPRVTEGPLGAELQWSRLLPLAIAPALLTPLILWPLPNDFLPIVIGDYIALHFGLYGLLTIIGLLLAGQRPSQLWHHVPVGAFTLALLSVGVYELLAIALPTDRFLSSFLPGIERTDTLLVLFVGTLLWFAADEWLTRGGRARGAYGLTKLLFLVSLMLAVALNLNELFFLVIIIPAILALFVIFGLFSGWIYHRTGHPMIAAISNALAFSSAITVSFPILA